jgi:hypothetical protein
MTMRKTASEKLNHGETMAEMWDGLRDSTIPRDAPPIQIQEMRNAFYAGAFCLFNWFMAQMSEGDEPTDPDLAKVSALSDELEAYFRQARRR